MEVRAGTITKPQMRHIYALAREGGLDSEELHAVIAASTGRESTKDLSSYEAKQVIDRLKRLAGQESTHAPNRPSKEQVALIFALVNKLGWGDDPTRLRAWLGTRYQVSHPSFLTARNTDHCIQAMRAMLAGGRGERKGGGHGRVDGRADG